MEKGYRLKYKDQWMAIRRCCGDYVYSLYDSEDDPNVIQKFPLKIANHLKTLANDDIYNEIEIIECGELTREEAELSIREILTKKIIR